MMALFSAVMSALGVSRRIFELLDAQPALRLSGGTTLVDLRGRIVLQDVTFEYPTRPGVQVLIGVSLEVDPGGVLALCGASGSGKSSVIALLERWYDFSSGSIEVDGVPLRDVDPSWWRRQVALVAQEPVLFNESVYDNLCYGRIEQGTRAAAEAAAKTANAHEFISMFKDGFDTLVGERGVTLSGGQKQRIAIARALMAEPRVLLLDEATSALDAESEALVQAAIDRLMQARTTLVIAHRLSTVRQANCICVMAAGRVAERGSHDQLIALGGVYEKLVQRQMGSAPPSTTARATPVLSRRQMGPEAA
jgi:ABC-type multidrug transport system fused ATPase/permease subunit